MNESENLTYSVSFRNLLFFAFPIFFSLFLNGLYSAIDLLMVSRFALSSDVSAVSVGSNFMAIVLSLFSGLSIGCSVELATRLSLGDYDNVGYLAGTSVRIFGFLGFFISIVLFFLSPFIAKVMHTPSESLARTIIYLRVSSLGCLPLSLMVLISSIFKALGNSKIPFIFVLISSSFNILLSFIFVRYFHIGTLGVALATVISQVLSITLAFLYIHRHHFPFKFSRKQIESHKGYTKRLLRVGLPIAFEEIFTEGSFVVILSFANTFGLYASAGVGIAGKILTFIMFIPLTFMQTESVFAAVSIGNGNIRRAKKSLYYSLILSLVIGVLVFIILEFCSRNIVSFFTKDTKVINEATEFLKVISLECLLLSLSHSFLGFFEGLEKTLFVALQGVVATIFLKIPFAYYKTFIEGVKASSILAFSLEIASVFELLLCCIYYFIFLKKTRWLKKII